jgi:protein phosphatase 1L
LDRDGSISAFLGVYDGHGGVATSDWLEKNLFSFVQDAWEENKDPEQALIKAFRAADSVLLSPTGWMGMGERGVGGSKCGSTAAVACIFQVR